MGFWKFWRRLILLDWIFGGRRSDTSANQTSYTSYDHDCDCGDNYGLPRSSGYSGSSWRNGSYDNDDFDDCDDGLCNGFNSNFDNFDDCDSFDRYDDFEDDF